MKQQLLDYNQVKNTYSDLSKGLKQAIQLSRESNEEKLKFLTIKEFDKFFENFGIFLNQTLDYEQTSIGGIKLKGRSDVLSGSLIMEFKTYNLLKNPAEYKKALKQVKEKYLAPINNKIAKLVSA